MRRQSVVLVVLASLLAASCGGASVPPDLALKPDDISGNPEMWVPAELTNARPAPAFRADAPGADQGPPSAHDAEPVLCPLPLPSGRPSLRAGGPRPPDLGVPEVDAKVFEGDWTRITNTTATPWRWIGKLYSQYDDGTWLQGTGFLVGDHHILTAGHCIYERENNIQDADHWANVLYFIPGLNKVTEHWPGHGNWPFTAYKPFNGAWAVPSATQRGWAEDGNRAYDFGVARLDRNLGAVLGRFYYVNEDPWDLTHENHGLAGYPVGIQPGDELWYDYDPIGFATSLELCYKHDTASGQSGSPLWQSVWPLTACFVHGIHCWERSDTNGGVKIDATRVDITSARIRDDPQPTDRPDLVDDGAQYASFSPATLYYGDSFQVTCRVRNIGTAATGPFGVIFYASVDEQIDTSDHCLAVVPGGVSSLDPFASAEARADYAALGTQIPPGTYWVGWIADPDGRIQEFDDANNTGRITTSLLTIRGHRPVRVTFRAQTMNVGTHTPMTSDNEIEVRYPDEYGTSRVARVYDGHEVTVDMQYGGEYTYGAFSTRSTSDHGWRAPDPPSGRLTSDTTITGDYWEQYKKPFQAVVGTHGGGLPPGDSVPVTVESYGETDLVATGQGGCWVDAGSTYAYALESTGSGSEERWRSRIQATGTVADASPAKALFHHQYLCEVTLDGTDAEHRATWDSTAFEVPVSGQAQGTWQDWCDQDAVLSFSEETTGSPPYVTGDVRSWTVSGPLQQAITYWSLAPTLSWTRETGYRFDGIRPNRGRPDKTRFRFRVKLTDYDGDEPRVVRLILRKDGALWRTVRLQPGDGATDMGRIYSTALQLPVGNYAYRFRAADEDGPATGEPTKAHRGPVLPAPPWLRWVGGAGYEGDGVDPDSGLRNDTVFRFKAICSSHDGDPATYVRLRLWRNGTYYRTFSMVTQEANPNPQEGVVYERARKLPAGSYEYQVVAADPDGLAVGPASVKMSGPTVSRAGTGVGLTSVAAVPTAAGAQVTFTLTAEADVSATVLNIAGRRVRRLCTAHACDAGTNTLVWNGQGDNGLKVPAGMYLVQVEAQTAEGERARVLGTVRLTR